MDYDLKACADDTKASDIKTENLESYNIMGEKASPRQDTDNPKNGGGTKEEVKGNDVKLMINTETEDTTGEVNMEAAIAADDVIRAGGFGATDSINNFCPVAMDSTDFEASLRYAREFEEPQGDTSRPGLGWKETNGSEEH
ncbi:hypothetical protein QJS10_CPB04g00452 [Acorus calamus]|uniref:Uncharacterized protein n=1 Tax=Acorus calamus TaxID=4465 RepID=A0AAV9F1H2_ACOCL|nr:hypothetical protein QJS10_CPB04g00452 [Acorus calamus]